MVRMGFLIGGDGGAGSTNGGESIDVMLSIAAGGLGNWGGSTSGCVGSTTGEDAGWITILGVGRACSDESDIVALKGRAAEIGEGI